MRSPDAPMTTAARSGADSAKSAMYTVWPVRSSCSAAAARPPAALGLLALGGGPLDGVGHRQQHRRRVPPVGEPVLDRCRRGPVVMNFVPVGVVHLVQGEAGL